ncbi:na[+]-dependent inorganic phosphate cotransporter [Halictus rubicundus]|uniref:na[+]-dependent inorganic phosphate cotransporter n=1 Tax=Halictus rubicundus TaxID=77578 RepID=UPI004035A713
MPSNNVCQDGASVDNLIGKVKLLAILEESPNDDPNARSDQCTTCLQTKQLSNIQMTVYHRLHKLIDGGANKVILIDAPSGTGKTHILSTFAQKYGEGVQFAVFRRDQASQLMLRQVSAYTYVSYNMRNFHLNYREALCMFTVSGLDNTDVIYKLITYANKYVHVSNVIKVIILDAYTIVSPLMLLLLYIVSLKNKITLIFAGNKMQLRSINNTPQLHNRNNSDIIEIFSDLTINELTANLRSDDKNFLKKVSRFGNAIASYKTKKQIPFHFNLRYLLYSLFRNKYDPRITENFDALYMASFHHVITKRLYRFMKYLDPTKYRIEPFFLVPFNCDETNKFFPGLLLVQNFKYIYITEKGVHNVVVLEDMLFDHSGIVSGLVVRYEDGRKQTIVRCILNYYQLLPAYRNWLLDQMKIPKHTKHDICNFPLKPYTMTYHAALGHTISDPVELSTNCVDASSIYVGLCSLPSESNICKFHAEDDFLSFVATDFMASVDNQEYYYRYPTQGDGFNILDYLGNKDGDEYIKSFLMGVSWITVENINQFENKKCKRFLRIRRSVYEKNRKEVDSTIPSPLMQITKFVKDNPTVILDTIKNMRLDSKVNMNNTKSKEYRKLPTYDSLSKAYNEWLVHEKENNKK